MQHLSCEQRLSHYYFDLTFVVGVILVTSLSLVVRRCVASLDSGQERG